MLDAALTAAEVVEHDLTHDAPAKTRSPAQRLVHVGDADNVFSDEGVHLTRERRLKSIGDVSGPLLPQTHCLLAEPIIKLGGPPNGRRRSLGAADDLDEGNKVRRVERM